MSHEATPFRYSRPPIDPEGKDSLAILARWIDTGSEVLDLGASTGALGRHLTAHGCLVDGVEIDPGAAATARAAYRSLVEADLETAKLHALFHGRRYDAVVCADVLEHVRDPGRILEQVRELLKPSGALLVSVPNIAYAGVVLELLGGEFVYRPLGILDATHLRFYTRKSLLQSLTAHGFHPDKLEAVTLSLNESEFGSGSMERIPPRLLRAVREQPDALVYQFIVRAKLEPSISQFSLPPRLPFARFTAQLFWRGERAPYAEARSVSATAPLDTEVHELRFPLPAHVGDAAAFRLDPSDRPGFIQLHSLAEENESGQTRWKWLAGEGPPPVRPLQQLMAIPGGPVPTFLSLGEDPSFELFLSEKVDRALIGVLVLRISLLPTAEALAVARGLTEGDGRLAERLAQTEARLVDASHSDQLRLEQRLAQTEAQLVEIGERQHALLMAAQAEGEDTKKLSENIGRLETEVQRLRANLEKSGLGTKAVLSRLSFRIQLQFRRMLGPVLPRRAKAYFRRRQLERHARLITNAGLFDSAFYLSQNLDVGAAGLNPIHHYLTHGAAEGRDPHEMFDTSYYLEQNPDVASGGLNPLLHYCVHGLAEGRRPHPGFSADQYSAATSRRPARPTLEPSSTTTLRQRLVVPRPRFRTRPFEEKPPQADASKPLGLKTLCVSHVLPFPPRAGNEYRIHRIVQWLQSIGHDVLLVVCPLPGEMLDAAEVVRAAREYPNLIVCQRDGTVLYQSRRPEVRGMLVGLDGEHPRTFSTTAAASRAGLSAKVADLEQTFCPDPLLDILLRLETSSPPDMAISNYVFMSRFLPLLQSRVFKVIDTIDVFSTKLSKVVRFGVTGEIDISAEEECALLRRADLVVAIQPDEALELQKLAPDRIVVTAGVDFQLVEKVVPPPVEPVVLYVASGNALNVKGVRDFLSLAWPLVRRSVPDARLLIVGPVCEAVGEGFEGVELLGRVDRLDDVYARAKVVVNLAVAGTGLKIKTLEALSHLRPIVVWPSGVDGLSEEAQRFCDVAQDWYDFARRVVRQLTGEGARDIAAHSDEIRREFSPEVVYGPLRTAIAAGVRAASSREAPGE
jgi:2-polyprenyl-3-methyl-5-hydroxy-6-metoxy-1,4-benzoquinol methylase/glycosyltransferase involved in cell wall biosynthesis